METSSVVGRCFAAQSPSPLGEQRLPEPCQASDCLQLAGIGLGARR